ncbi:acylphosphatase [Variibacter gotjawalensis]|uniref:acylphosphatase n=1 Tax=Variibacter gotjawalensis TaxID=1333996 RepID=A0A0S3PWQ1_9BRAD|nr:acylphosphatase [Variibacter gotjawalensis]NIK46200.1 acylphosphatase [Variibacter gotjawalensis]RZS48117.1 acylphosphatase [Variibacter gotjawalensis]BAT60374.1 acylphosphatase [Variibacter gotjawalensis]
MTRVHVFVRGRVQGVGYRAWTADEAAARGLTGFVRNRRDGSVEALLVGDETSVRAMIGAMRSGPPMARVDAIEEDTPASEVLRLAGDGRFEMLPTA